MANRLSTFRQADIARAIKGAQAAGLEVVSFELCPDGRIIVLSKSAANAKALDPLEKWEAAYRARKA